MSSRSKPQPRRPRAGRRGRRECPRGERDVIAHVAAHEGPGFEAHGLGAEHVAGDRRRRREPDRAVHRHHLTRRPGPETATGPSSTTTMHPRRRLRRSPARGTPRPPRPTARGGPSRCRRASPGLRCARRRLDGSEATRPARARATARRPRRQGDDRDERGGARGGARKAGPTWPASYRRPRP